MRYFSLLERVRINWKERNLPKHVRQARWRLRNSGENFIYDEAWGEHTEGWCWVSSSGGEVCKSCKKYVWLYEAKKTKEIETEADKS